jgi:hypothetical protein
MSVTKQARCIQLGGVVSVIVAISNFFIFHNLFPHFQIQGEQQSKWGKKRNPNNKLLCSPVPPTNSSTHKPVWIPGYPGSGNQLSRALVLQISGLRGKATIGGAGCQKYPATCKTHCPIMRAVDCPTSLANNKNSVANYYHPNAVLLLRNPRYALPSRVNNQWENEQRRRGSNVPSHSKQAPLEDWKKMRNDNFPDLFRGWKQTIVWWMLEAGPYHVSLIVPYEQLTNPKQGPILLGKIANELREANISSVVSSAEQIECLWRKVVLSKNSTTKRSSGTSEERYIPPFTLDQQSQFLKGLDELITTFSDGIEDDVVQMNLVQILQGYRSDIATNLEIDK